MGIIAQGALTHRETGSAKFWFIIGIIPVVNVYFLWKAVENISGHETITEKHRYLNHLRPRDSPAKLFGTVFTPLAVIGVIVLIDGLFGWYLFASVGEVVMSILWIIFGVIVLYIIYRVAELVAGHDKPNEHLEHLRKRKSVGKWFIIGIIPVVNLYFLWKAAEIISGHGTVQSGSEE